jgi:hypothetical protein
MSTEWTILFDILTIPGGGGVGAWRHASRLRCSRHPHFGDYHNILASFLPFWLFSNHIPDYYKCVWTTPNFCVEKVLL